MFKRAIVTAAALVLACAWTARAEGTVTIVGKGNGPATIIDKDGSIQTVRFPDASRLEEQGKAHAEARAIREKEDAEARARDEEARKKAAVEAEAQRQKDEAAKAKQAAAEAKAAKEREVTRQKEVAHYVNKDYTYGPGSAKKVDRTAGIVNTKKKIREEGIAETSKSAGSPKVTVGGQTRIRYNNYKP